MIVEPTVGSSEQRPGPIRLLIADDHALARAGVAGLVVGSEIEVIGQASTCEEAVRFSAACAPDVVLLDVRMPDADGFEALVQIKQQRPATPVIMFSAADDLDALARARQLGAAGFLCKSASRDEVLQSIRRAALGRGAWSRLHIRKASKKLASDSDELRKIAPLTPREFEIIGMIAQGMVNEEIAQELGISIDTVKHHMQRMFAKITVEDRTQAALWALRAGLLDRS